MWQGLNSLAIYLAAIYNISIKKNFRTEINYNNKYRYIKRVIDQNITILTEVPGVPRGIFINN